MRSALLLYKGPGGRKRIVVEVEFVVPELIDQRIHADVRIEDDDQGARAKLIGQGAAA